MRTVTFKNLRLKNPLIMSPMCGVTDLPFRRLVAGQGAALVHTPMVSSTALVRGARKKTFDIMDVAGDEGPVGVQLFGCNPTEMAESARLVEQTGCDLISINFGCPVPKVVKHNGGSAMLKQPAAVEAVTRAVVEAVRLPVVPKIRTGWDLNSVNAVDIARRIEAAGAHGLAIHGRTRSQGYGGRADWELIAKVKKVVRIPVIGNGDLFEPIEVDRALRQSGVDAVMLGRGAMGNPWLFSRTLAFWKTGLETPATPAGERIAMLKRHCLAMHEYKGAHGLAQMRKHAMWYLKGLPHSAKYRQRINQTLDRDEIVEILDEYQVSLKVELSQACAA